MCGKRAILALTSFWVGSGWWALCYVAENATSIIRTWPFCFGWSFLFLLLLLVLVLVVLERVVDWNLLTVDRKSVV